MKKILIIALIAFLVACSKDPEPRLMYDITFSVTATNGATINKIEYMDGQGVVQELTNVSSPWSINIQSRAGLGLQAAAYGDIPYQGILSISASWKPEGGDVQSESESLPNNTQNSTFNNAMVEISGRTLPD